MDNKEYNTTLNTSAEIVVGGGNITPIQDRTVRDILASGKRYVESHTDKKTYKYKCLIGLRNNNSEPKINFKYHNNDLNKSINVFNETNTDCKVKIMRVDVDKFAIKVTTNRNLLGRDDLFFLCLNAISSNLNLLGFKKYSEATNGRLFYIIDIEEIKNKSDDVVNDQSIKINIDELVKKIKVLSELIEMGLDEDGSRAIALKEILDTVNNELL